MIVRRELAYDFLLFCQRNPKPCPLLDVTDPGASSRHAAPGADIRTDFPRYRIYRNGELDQEVQDITPFWEDDMVAFSSAAASVSRLHCWPMACQSGIEDGHNVPMYRTNIACQPAGGLSGPMVVSMRPMPANKVVRAVQVTSRFPCMAPPCMSATRDCWALQTWPNRISVSHPSCAKARSRCSGPVA